MKVYPDIVESCEEFNSKNQFNSINSLDTISNSRNYNEDKPFILTTIVRYILINRIYDSSSRIITKYPTLEVVIGPDVAVDAILGIPSIEGLHWNCTLYHKILCFTNFFSSNFLSNIVKQDYLSLPNHY